MIIICKKAKGTLNNTAQDLNLFAVKTNIKGLLSHLATPKAASDKNCDLVVFYYCKNELPVLQFTFAKQLTHLYSPVSGFYDITYPWTS